MKAFAHLKLKSVAEVDHKGTIHIEFTYDCIIHKGVVHTGLMPKELWDTLPDIDIHTALPLDLVTK